MENNETFKIFIKLMNELKKQKLIESANFTNLAKYLNISRVSLYTYIRDDKISLKLIKQIKASKLIKINNTYIIRSIL